MENLERIEIILKEQKEILKQKYGIKELGIFGSYVRGQTDKTSDLDILVEFTRSLGLLRFAVLYARVSSSDQKQDLDRQLSRLMEYATSSGLQVSGAIKEVGSGLNGKRKKLLALLKDPEVNTIVVEHKDRLARFGFEYMEASLSSAGRRVIVVDESEMKEDLVQDMIDVLTSFCARLYGRRSAKNRAKKALKEIEKC